MPVGFKLDDVEFSTDALSSHPEHAAALGKAVTTFSLLEGAIGGIFGVLKHKAVEDALEELEKLPTNARRVQAVRNEIKVNPPSVAAELDELMKDVLSYAERRNRIAHGLWGSKQDEADVVYRLPVKTWIPFVAGLVASGTDGTFLEATENLKGKVDEYRLADLLALQTDGVELLTRVMEAFVGLAKVAAVADGWEQVH